MNAPWKRGDVRGGFGAGSILPLQATRWLLP
jgi:hypothetical protein